VMSDMEHEEKLAVTWRLYDDMSVIVTKINTLTTRETS
jgi:hypothetical protein